MKEGDFIKNADSIAKVIFMIFLILSVFPCLSLGGESKSALPPMSQYVIPDPFLGCPAWTFLAPRDWTKQGGVAWTGGLAPAYYTDLTIRNPQGTEEFRLFPIFVFADTAQPVLANGAEIRRYADPAASIRDIIIPRCRREIQGGRFIASERLPQFANKAAEIARAVMPGARADAARTLVEYTLRDRQMEEMFFCVTIAAQGMGVVHWAIDRPVSLRAQKGKLEAAFPVLGTIAGSLYENPGWVSMRREELARRVAARSRPPQTSVGGGGPSILDVSRGMAKAQDDFRKGLNQSSAARDRATQSWTEAFRGVHARENPVTHETIYVPNGYERYYETNLGTRFGSNDVIGDPWVNYHINAVELQTVPKKR